MRIFDEENQVGRSLTVAETVKLKQAFRAGKIRDCVGEVLAYKDCLDRDGDIVLDESAYELALEEIRLARS